MQENKSYLIGALSMFLIAASLNVLATNPQFFPEVVYSFLTGVVLWSVVSLIITGVRAAFKKIDFLRAFARTLAVLGVIDVLVNVVTYIKSLS